MAKRESNIYLRKDGRYEGRVVIGYTESGKNRYKSVYARTLAEVKQRSSVFNKLKKFSAQALSRQLPFRDILCLTPLSLSSF